MLMWELRQTEPAAYRFAGVKKDKWRLSSLLIVLSTTRDRQLSPQCRSNKLPTSPKADSTARHETQWHSVTFLRRHQRNQAVTLLSFRQTSFDLRCASWFLLARSLSFPLAQIIHDS